MFQFTHPGKGATSEYRRVQITQMFQFTHPGKGATANVYLRRPASKVSIHAPWEGCDSEVCILIILSRSFNSRTLGRVRPHLGRVSQVFSTVSIHAPWEGCDPLIKCTPYGTTCFNSRTLGRVRPRRVRRKSFSIAFQFTHPGKGATCCGCSCSFRSSSFQFTHPGKGATQRNEGSNQA